MSSSRSPSRILLHWKEGLTFVGSAEGGPQITVASSGKEGPSPTQLLLLSLGGCMGVDVVDILRKSRVPVEALEVEVEGDRVAESPRRFEAIRLTYRVRGPSDDDEDKLQRAVQLSKDRYCSVLHTLRPDLDLDVRIVRT